MSDSFDLDYDREEYEQKIAAIVRNYLSYARSNDRSSLGRRKEAVRTLKAEDHYLLVLIDPLLTPAVANRSNLLKLFGIGFVLACLALAIIYVFAGR